MTVVWPKASQWHKMFRHDPEVMGSNPSWGEPKGVQSFCLSQDSNQKHVLFLSSDLAERSTTCIPASIIVQH